MCLSHRERETNLPLPQGEGNECASPKGKGDEFAKVQLKNRFPTLLSALYCIQADNAPPRMTIETFRHPRAHRRNRVLVPGGRR